MAPPISLWTDEEARKSFYAAKPENCRLKELTQYQCVPYDRDIKKEYLCHPFVRIFKECEFRFRDKRNDQIQTVTRRIEVTLPEDNEVFDKYSSESVAEFIRCRDKMDNFYKRP